MNCDDKALVKLLIASGANVNLANNRGDTPLHLAARYIPLVRNKFPLFMSEREMEIANFAKDNIEIIELLLSNGAEFNAINEIGETPLESALQSNYANPHIRNGLIEIEKVLILAMLLQDPEIKKPGFLEKYSGKELSYYWDKQSERINRFLSGKVIATELQTQNILDRVSREGNSTLRGRLLFSLFQNVSLVKKNDHSQSEGISSKGVRIL